MTTNKYFPFILCFGLMCVHFISGYPGGMTTDSMDQFQQSLSGNFSAHHPPVMAMLWSLLNRIYQGPQIILFLHLFLLWGGVLLLFYADESNKFRWLYFFIPFTPQVLSHSTMIWKDIGFGLSMFFIISACIFYTYRPYRAPLWVIISLLIICFYGIAIKFQGQFIAPLIILFISSVYFKDSIRLRLIACSIVSFIIIYGNILLINNFSTNGHSEQLRQFFDITGISIRINNDDVFPSYAKTQSLYNFDKIKIAYTPCNFDPLFFGDTTVYKSTQDLKLIQEMNRKFFTSISLHPLPYIKHRTAVLTCNLVIGKSWEYSFIANPEQVATYDIPIHPNFLQKITIKYLSLFSQKFTANFVSLSMIILYITYILFNRNKNTKELGILKYISIVAIGYSVALFFTAVASDYRYFYIIRILSFFSLPIYLKAQLITCKTQQKL